MGKGSKVFHSRPYLRTEKLCELLFDYRAGDHQPPMADSAELANHSPRFQQHVYPLTAANRSPEHDQLLLGCRLSGMHSVGHKHNSLWLDEISSGSGRPFRQNNYPVRRPEDNANQDWNRSGEGIKIAAMQVSHRAAPACPREKKKRTLANERAPLGEVNDHHIPLVGTGQTPQLTCGSGNDPYRRETSAAISRLDDPDVEFVKISAPVAIENLRHPTSYFAASPHVKSPGLAPIGAKTPIARHPVTVRLATAAESTE